MRRWPRLLIPGLITAIVLAACTPEYRGLPLGVDAHSTIENEDAPQYSDWSAPVNLGPVLNTTFLEQGTSISKDGLRLYFQSDRPGGAGLADIYVSHRACRDFANPGCAWQTPVNLVAINTPSTDGTARESHDGRLLYFHSNRPGGLGSQDIYVSRRADKHDDASWEPAVNLGSGVNSSFIDQQADPFEDEAAGTTILYFASDRPGAGAFDIYASTLRLDGTFGPAAPVAELNTAASDQQPAVARGGLTMYVGSDRPGTIGSIDLWVTTRPSTAAPWTAPVNLGSVVNSVVQDGRPAISWKGTELYFQSPRPGGIGGFDIWVTTRTRLDDDDRHGGPQRNH
jgi:hypothetical protein